MSESSDEGWQEGPPAVESRPWMTEDALRRMCRTLAHEMCSWPDIIGVRLRHGARLSPGGCGLVPIW